MALNKNASGLMESSSIFLRSQALLLDRAADQLDQESHAYLDTQLVNDMRETADRMHATVGKIQHRLRTKISVS